MNTECWCCAKQFAVSSSLLVQVLFRYRRAVTWGLKDRSVFVVRQRELSSVFRVSVWCLKSSNLYRCKEFFSKSVK